MSGLKEAAAMIAVVTSCCFSARPLSVFCEVAVKVVSTVMILAPVVSISWTGKKICTAIIKTNRVERTP